MCLRLDARRVLLMRPDRLTESSVSNRATSRYEKFRAPPQHIFTFRMSRCGALSPLSGVVHEVRGAVKGPWDIGSIVVFFRFGQFCGKKSIVFCRIRGTFLTKNCHLFAFSVKITRQMGHF